MAVFDARIVSALDADGLLERLSDPAYQVTLNRARLTASGTERALDSDLLVKMMTERAQRDDRLIRASVGRAVEVIDDVDESALEGFTFWLASAMFGFNSGLLEEGLREWNDSLGLYPHANLPFGINWLDHLHILGLIRLDTSGTVTLRSTDDWFTRRYPGLVSVGFDQAAGDEIDRRVQEIYPGDDFTFVQHELKPGVLRLAYQGADQVDRILQAHSLPAETREELLTLLKDEGKLEEVDHSLRPALLERICAHDVLSELHHWRSQVPHAVNVTHVGWAIASASLGMHAVMPPDILSTWLLPKS